MNELRFDGGKWVCPFCGCDYFVQTVIAENFVVFTNKNGVLVESGDYEGSWQGIDRGNVHCGKCYKDVSVPDGAWE